MADDKMSSAAFPIEDEDMRDLLRGHALGKRTPLEYADISVKVAHASERKDNVSTRIRKSQGVIALATENILASSEQEWEIEGTKADGKPILAMWPRPTDRTIVSGLSTKAWPRPAIAAIVGSI